MILLLGAKNKRSHPKGKRRSETPYKFASGSEFMRGVRILQLLRAVSFLFLRKIGSDDRTINIFLDSHLLGAAAASDAIPASDTTAGQQLQQDLEHLGTSQL